MRVHTTATTYMCVTHMQKPVSVECVDQPPEPTGRPQVHVVAARYVYVCVVCERVCA